MKKNNTHKNILKECIRSEKGVILPITVVLLIVLTLLIFVGAQWAQTDVKRTKNYTKTRQAFYVAESGIQMALNHLNYNGGTGGTAADGFDDELADGDGSSWDTEANGSTWPMEDFLNFSYNNGTYTVTIRDNDDGDSDLTVDKDSTVIITSIGTKRGKTSTIEAILYRGDFSTSKAFLTDDDVVMDGGITINGDIHSNAGMSNNGDNTINGMASANTTPCASPCTQMEKVEYIPLITQEMFETLYKPLADIILLEGNPAKFEWRQVSKWDIALSPPAMTGLGTYEFEKISTNVWDGTYEIDPITFLPTTTKNMVAKTCWKPLSDDSPTRCDGSDPDLAPTIPPTPATPGTAVATQQSFYKLVADNFGDVNRTGSNVWKFNGDNLPSAHNGMLVNGAVSDVYIYVEHKNLATGQGGKLVINNTPNPIDTSISPDPLPWDVTIISTGAIAAQANAILGNFKKPGLSTGQQDLFLMAGTDIEVAGGGQFRSATGALEGYIYARDQVGLGGTVYMEGAVLAKDDEESPTNEFDGLISYNKIHGNFTINFNSMIEFDFPGPVQILSWREIWAGS